MGAGRGCLAGHATALVASTVMEAFREVCLKVPQEPPFLQPKAASAPPHGTWAPHPCPAPLPFSAHAAAPQGLSSSLGPRTGPSARAAASPVPSTGGRSLPCSCCPTIADTGQHALGLPGHLGTRWLTFSYCGPAALAPFLPCSCPGTKRHV